jgi:signal peptide peptidase SppA
MKHVQFIAQALTTPWALQREVLSGYASFMAKRYAANIDATSAAPQAAKPKAIANQKNGSIAVIPLMGTVMQRAGMLELCDGGTSVQTFTQNFRSAMSDETVSQILIEIDSPGGSVYGVGELAAEIMQARGTKPVVAIANSLAASAAYWVGCAASEFYVTPGGEVGSIGVWQAHEDWSKAMEEAGVKVTLVSAGKYKVEGNPYAPLDQEAQDFMQERTQDYYQSFVKAVAKGRNVSVDSVRNGMGQGRVLGADAALKEKMVDGVMTFDEVVKRMQSNARKTNQSNRSALQAATNELKILG